MAKEHVQSTELSLTYVVIVPPGQYDVNVDTKRLVRAFGRYGDGVFAPIQNGFIVQMGPANQLVMQLPKIQFQAANEDVLVELYQNAQLLMLGPFMSKAAQAFGINFHVAVVFPDLSRETVLQRLSGERLPDGVAVTRLGLKRKALLQSKVVNYQIQSTGDESQGLKIDINNHFPSPGKASLSLDELRREIADARQEYHRFLEELWQCAQQPN